MNLPDARNVVLHTSTQVRGTHLLQSNVPKVARTKYVHLISPSYKPEGVCTGGADAPSVQRRALYAKRSFVKR